MKGLLIDLRVLEASRREWRDRRRRQQLAAVKPQLDQVREQLAAAGYRVTVKPL